MELYFSGINSIDAMSLAEVRKDESPTAIDGIQAVIFDLDGTLVDSIPEITQACNAALWDLEKGLPFTEKHFALMAGNGNEILAARLLTAADLRAAGHITPVSTALRTACPTNIDEKRLTNFVASKLQHEDTSFQAGHSPVAAFPGIHGLLQTLNKKAIPIAVLSNKRNEAVARTCTALFTDISFVTVEGARPGSPPPKPTPEALLKIIQKFSLSPSSVAMVGDTDVDMKTGRAAGVRRVAVTYGFRDAEELSASGAEIICNSAQDLRIALKCDD